MVLLLLLFGLSLLWWPMGGLTLWNLAHCKKLKDLPLPEDPDFAWPSLTIIAPARNEADALEMAIRQRLATDYPDVQIVLINDRSEDDTGAIADAIAAQDTRLRVVHNDTLPPDWLGKLHALHLGTQAADSTWLLLSDADVEIAPDALRRAIYFAETHHFDMVAAMPTLHPVNPVLDALHAVFLRVLYAACIAHKIEDPNSPYGAGVGAFTLLRKSALDASEGFAAIRLEIADDLMLGRLLKQSSARCTVLNGAQATAVNIYPTTWDFVRGAEKNAWGVSAGFSLLRGIASALLLLLIDLAPFLLLPLTWAQPNPLWWTYALACTLWAIIVSFVSLHQNGRSPWGALLYPIGTLVFVFSAIRGTLIGWSKGGLQWRDTFYPTSLFLDFQRERKRARNTKTP